MKAKRNQTHMLSVEWMTNEAIEFIQKHCPPEGFFVAFSGGKDSIVTLELVRMSGVKHEAFYSATGIDPPEVVKFIRQNYPEVKHLRPKQSFYALCKRWYPPSRLRRWCCEELKEKPTLKIKLKNRIVGIRSEESIMRAKRPRIAQIDRHKGMKHIKPIFHWKEWHVWDFIEAHSLSYPSLYDEGFDRIGCIVCPFICSTNQKQIQRNKSRWPGIYKAFEHACAEYFWSKRWPPRGIDDFQTPEEYVQAWYRGFEK